MTAPISAAEFDPIRAGFHANPEGSGKSEHAVHHFHGLVLDAYARAAA